jgi:hypothetical protein
MPTARRLPAEQLRDLGGDPLSHRCRLWLADWTGGEVTIDRIAGGYEARWGDRRATLPDAEADAMGAMRVLCTLLDRLDWTHGSRPS